MSTPNNSDKASKNGKNAPPPTPGDATPKATEAQFLEQQAVDAKAAIARTLSDLGTSLGNGASISAWTREYPWLTLGASTVAGFVAAAAIVPSKEQQALRRLAKIERALNPEPPKNKKSDSEDGHGTDDVKRYQSGRQSFLRSVMGEVIKAVQPAVLSMLTAGVTAHAAKPSEEEMEAAAAKEDQKSSAGYPPTP